MKNTRILLSMLMVVWGCNAQAQVWGTTTVTTTTTGNCSIGGGVIDMTMATDGTWRYLKAGSSTAGLGMLSTSTLTNGTSIQLAGPTYTSGAGQIFYNSYRTGGAHYFQNYDIGSSSFRTNAAISAAGQMIVGLNTHISDIAGGDILTVRNQIGFLVSNFTTNVALNGNNPSSAMNINENTGISNGPAISLSGMSATTAAGQLYYYSFGQGGAHVFANSNSSSVVHTNASISALGQTILGYDTHISDIVNGDVLTVKNQMGFMATGSTANINGNAPSGVLSIQENTNATNGPSILLNGISSTPALGAAGQVLYNAYGSTGYGHYFSNYDPTTSTAITRMGMKNDGTVQIGKNIISGALSYPTGYTLNVENGIGTTGNLMVQGGEIKLGLPSTGAKNIVANSTDSWLGILGGTNAGGLADGAYMQLFANGNVAGNGSAYIVTSGDATNSGVSFVYQPPSGAANVWNMSILNSGKVLIGKDLIYGGLTTMAPDGYLLYVEKGILTEKLKVANSGDIYNWSDFVFNKGYNLMPLSKLESYVKINKHLPEIPSAAEVAKDGIDVASMDAKLLQKIEELTLYVIEQQKQIDELKQQLKH